MATTPPDLSCPLCNYNLTGLTTPQCPECGHTFDWDELTDPARQKLRWLFEHTPSLTGYLQTCWRLLVPWRFWRELRPAHALYPTRMLLFTFILAIPTLIATAGSQLVNHALKLHDQSVISRRNWANRPAVFYDDATPFRRLHRLRLGLPRNPTGLDVYVRRYHPNLTPQRYLDHYQPLFPSRQFFVGYRFSVDPRRIALPFVLAVTPWCVTLVVLGVMRQTFSRARIRPGHALRVATYAAFLLPTLCWSTGLVLYYLPVSITAGRQRGLDYYAARTLPVTLWSLYFLTHLYFALRLYLQIKSPLKVTLAAAIILFLTDWIFWTWSNGLRL